MSAGGSTKVIIISLCANLGIAISKLAGALFTGSAALMAESVHSFSDCGNQALLLYGQHVAKKPPTAHYPLGRSKELFFWSFVVALLLFSMGGMFSLYEGLHKLEHPEPLKHPIVGIVILLVAVGLEGFSFWACLKEVRHQLHGDTLWQWIKKTTSADLLVIFLEDTAALLGLVFALAALVLAWVTGNTMWDALGSCVIGVLLLVVAVVLAREVKQLLIGQMPSVDYQVKLESLLAEKMPGAQLVRFIALQQGVGAVLVAYKICPADMKQEVGTTIAAVNAFERAVKEAYPEIQWQFAELDVAD
jgi:cation diffusion facilitator family transporter